MRSAERPSRVVHSHTIARRALAAAGVFALVALVWGLIVLARGGSWWGPLHAFLAGTVVLAISGASQMFTITWAAAPPPPSWLTSLQRGLIVVGVTMILVGVPQGIGWLVWTGAIAVAGGLVVAAGSIVGAVRRSLLRRFDLSARFYLTAFASGVVGVVLGAALGSGSTGDAFATVRLVHYHLNLVGLVGFTIIGTLPTFLPTVAHHRAVSGREAVAAWWMCLGSAALFLSGLALPSIVIGLGSLIAGLAGLLVLGGIVWRLRRTGRAQTQFLQIVAGVSWLIAWAFVDGAALVTDRSPAVFSAWTAAAVVAGVGQVLLGSLAYLIPVLLGPPLGERLALLEQRPLIPLSAANVAGLALVVGLPTVAVVTVGLWLADFAWRLLRQRSLLVP